MKKETKKVITFKDVLEFKPEVFIPKRNDETLDSNGDPILLDGQAASLLNEKSLLETDAKSNFKLNMEQLSKTLAKIASSKEGLSLVELYPLRKQYLAHRLRIEKGNNSPKWILRGAGMCFDAVVSKALYATALHLSDNVALTWDKQLNQYNKEHQVLLKPQQKERSEFVSCNMVDLSQPEIDVEDLGIFGEEYPEGTDEAWMFRS